MRSQRSLRLCVKCFLALAAPAFCQTQSLSQGPQRLEITLERQDGNSWRAVVPGLVFRSDDRIRFRVRGNFDGYLYVMNQTTSGNYVLLFPTEDAGRKNRIEANQQYLVPASQGAFRITGPPGQEIVYWLVTPVELKSEPDYVPLPPPPKPGKVPPSLTPRCDDTILRARGDCVDTSAGLKPLAEGSGVPENLTGIPAAASRDLVFVRQAGASVVSAPSSLKGPVIFEFRLAHR